MTIKERFDRLQQDIHMLQEQINEAEVQHDTAMDAITTQIEKASEGIHEAREIAYVLGLTD